MYFANPWGLLGLASLPVIAVIHLYRRRFPPLSVAGLHLWAAQSEVRRAGRRRERLPITATLLLELLAALLLSLGLSRPMFGKLDSASHLVVVLDNSASMSARAAGEPSFRDAAITELENRVAKSTDTGVFTLLVTGRRPVLLAGPAASWQETRQALAGWNPHDAGHDFQAAWDLAAQLTENVGRVLFLTDHLPPDERTLPARMEVVSLGKPADNVAIITAGWTFDSAANRGSVVLRLANLGARPAAVRVLGKSGLRIIFDRGASLPAGGQTTLETDVPGGLGSLVVNLEWPPDALAIDNTALLLEPKARPVTIAISLPDDHSALPAVRRALAGIPHIRLGNEENADLIVAPASVLPPSRADLWWLGIGPVDPSAQALSNARDLIGPFLVEKRNPLLDGVLLSGLIWAGVQPLDVDVTPLVSAGRSMLLAQLNGTRTAGYLLNIDMSRSNLADSPDWPILIHNLVNLRRADLPGLARWNYRLNENIRFRFSAGDQRPQNQMQVLTLVHESKLRPLARGRVVEVPPLDEPGIYEIRDGDQPFDRFAVNFVDRNESTLTELAPGMRLPTARDSNVTDTVDNPHSWIVTAGIGLILIVIFLDWIVLNQSENPVVAVIEP